MSTGFDFKNAITIFACNPEKSFEAMLTAECDHAARANELMLDLMIERELYPPTEVEQPEEIPAEVVLDWDAYQGES